MSDSGYIDALEAAGAIVLAHEAFGSYQGDWIAKVVYNGRAGFLQGAYGSCSGCDPFEAEFGSSMDHYLGTDKDGEPDYDSERHSPLYDDAGFRPGCKQCDEGKQKLVEFGKGMLADGMILSQEEAEKKFEKESSWSAEDGEALEWIREHSFACGACGVTMTDVPTIYDDHLNDRKLPLCKTCAAAIRKATDKT